MIISRRNLMSWGAGFAGAGALGAGHLVRAADKATAADDASPFRVESFGRLAQPKKLPDLSVQNEQGEAVPLTHWVGRPFILHFWATWCGPCKFELPSVDATAKALGSDGPAIVAVGVRKSTIPKIRAFYDAHGINTLPVLVDPDSQALTASADVPAALASLRQTSPDYKIPDEKAQSIAQLAVPRSLVVNAKGEIVAISVGNMDWSPEAVRRTVAALVG
ncbi:thiol:disulfide interchange protein II [Neokomagataea thailandica NBRC 106555]|uniref:TlpA family protein disulfide reductase n=2 Tax=Neokomagataea TaxID=1223423 RepID=A0A4Y6V2V8_9PROT|nr:MULTISPECIES: TlpA disulfide reductase family protein [Neokomagataea]QDH24392.1 TlpA family protein disulfide reductase [Neokomagataea tanensis]GBR53380.1 thiol:disulfide interchange protein II [Neokomagataea thailandica NBRC 106555]